MRAWLSAALQPDVARARPLLLEQLAYRDDGLDDARHDDEAVLRVLDGGALDVGEAPRSVIA